MGTGMRRREGVDGAGLTYGVPDHFKPLSQLVTGGAGAWWHLGAGLFLVVVSV